jgi:ADP-heptose:LPS heptosyltransferase
MVLALPALRALRRAHPRAQIDAVGPPALWSVAGSLVDRVVSIDRPLFAPLLAGRPSPELREWLAGTTLGVLWTAHDRSEVLRAAGVPRVIHRSPYPPPGIHAARWLLEGLEAPWDEAVLEPPLVIPTPGERDAGRRILSGMGLNAPVILHPGAGAAWKRWPAERFAGLAAKLRRRGTPVALLEGPADAPAVADVLSRLTGPVAVIREGSPRALAAILAAARLFVGNDSGPTHLAAAVGTPTVALFGPTDPASWSPLGARVVRGCTRRATAQGQVRVCDDPDCMSGIGVDTVLEALSITLSITMSKTW